VAAWGKVMNLDRLRLWRMRIEAPASPQR